jgi:hypothetical protein
MKASRILLMAIVIAYFPVKISLLATFHPPLWLRMGTEAIFWGTLFVVGIVSQRSLAKSK